MDQDVTTSTCASLVRTTDSSPTHDREVTHTADQTPTGLQINHPDITHVEHVDDSVMQIGDHSVEFLVDSGSSVTAVSNSFYQTLVRAGLHWEYWDLLRTGLVSFMGLQVEFPVLVCDLATGTDAIIGTNVLGSVLPHTLDIKNGLLFTEGVLHSSYTDGILLFPVVFLRWATARYHLIQKLCYTVLYGLPAVVRCHPVVY